MDRLRRDGQIEISVESVGHRSAFVSAVLATLPGARTETNPRRVILNPEAQATASARLWREPPEVQDALDTVVELAGRGPGRRQGRRQSATERKAVELRAVEAATEYFVSRAWEVEYVGDVASYDLDCKRDGRLLHVEVKGTTSLGHRVLLTRNEVRHARGTEAEVVLFVLSRVDLSIDENGSPHAEAGTERVIDPWVISDDSLEPVGFEYTLPMTDDG